MVILSNEGTSGEQSAGGQDQGIGQSGEVLGMGCSVSLLDKDKLYQLFDEQFGCLDNSTVLNHEEYLQHRELQVESGLFYFRHTQSFD